MHRRTKIAFGGHATGLYSEIYVGIRLIALKGNLPALNPTASNGWGVSVSVGDGRCCSIKQNSPPYYWSFLWYSDVVWSFCIVYEALYVP